MFGNNVKITEKALQHLKKKGRVNLVIEFPEHRLSSESVFIEIPEIFMKKPKDVESFQQIIIEGISVYISKSVSLPTNDVVIDLDSFLGIKTLSLSGFKANR